MSETQKLGGWFNGPVEIKTDAEQIVGRQAVVIGPDPTTAAIDALRAAITSRNGMLEAISEQLRLGFEAQITHQDANEMRIAVARDLHIGQMEELRELVSAGKQGVINTLLNSHETFRAELKEGFAALAERLDKLEQRLPTKLFAEMASVVDWAERIEQNLRATDTLLALKLSAIETKLAEHKPDCKCASCELRRVTGRFEKTLGKKHPSRAARRAKKA